MAISGYIPTPTERIRLSDVPMGGVSEGIRLSDIPEDVSGIRLSETEKPGFWAGVTAPPVPSPTVSEQISKYIPIKSSINQATYLYDVYKSANRLERDDYSIVAHQITGKPVSIEAQRQGDLERVMAWDKLEKEKARIGKTFGGKVGLIAGEMTSFMGEMFLTAGLGAGWKKVTEALTKKALTKYVGTKVGTLAAKTAGWGVAATIRTTIGMPQRYTAEFVKRRLPKEISLNEQGNLIFNWPEESPYTSFVKAWGDTVIEVASETAGGAITKGLGNILSKANNLPFGKKLLPVLFRGWKKLHPEKGWGAFVNKISTKAGYNGIIEEVGEEYLGSQLRAIFNVDDFGAGEDANIVRRMTAALGQDIKNTPVMFTAFAIPGVTRQVIGGARTEAEKLIESRLRFSPETKNKIIETLQSREVIEKRSEIVPEIKEEHGKRGGEYTDFLRRLAEQGVNPIEANKIASSVLKGQYPGTDIDFMSLKEKLSDSELNETFSSIIYDERLLDFQRKNLMEAWKKVSIKGQLPTPSEIKLISEFVDPDIAEALSQQMGWGRRVYFGALSALSFPKAVMASFDMSGPGRQGIVLAPLAGRKIYLNSIVEGVKALGSEKYAQLIMQNIETNPMYGLLQATGVDLTEWRGVKTKYGKYEEKFMSDFAQNIPGIRASERAYVTSLNRLRADTFYKIAEQWHGQNIPLSEYKQLAKFINHATGRGDIPKFMTGISRFANAAFFSPRLLISRFQTVGDLINPKTSQRVRKLIAADLTEFVGAGLLALWLFSLIPGVTVEKDPRKSDFGKIRFGITRIDFWAGYSQIARVVVQMMLNQQKATATGRVYKPRRAEIFTRFLESKLNPAVGAAVDIYRGQTFFGEEMKLEPPFLVEQLFQRLAPLFIQDVIDAIRFQGLGTASIVSPLAFFGIGAMTYPESISAQAFRLKDHYAQKVFGQKWDNLGNESQEAIRINYPQIQEYENQVRFERENWDFISRIQEENVAAGKKIQKSLSKVTQRELNSIGFKISGLSRYIGRGWYLNDERYKEYETNVQKDIQKVLPKITSHRLYQSMTPIAKREFLDRVIKIIKQTRRVQIKDSALKKDLINLMELKNVARK